MGYICVLLPNLEMYLISIKYPTLILGLSLKDMFWIEYEVINIYFYDLLTIKAIAENTTVYRK